MQADGGSNERRFIAGIDRRDFVASDVAQIVQSMEGWIARCTSDLEAARLTWPGLAAHHPLALQAGAANAAADAHVAAWTQQRKRLEPAQALADSLHDKIVLLVFGKFNAGKSSFCNLLAERFAAYAKTVEYFHLDAARIVETCSPLKEGVTETTSQLQGVRLAGSLVLVDTPGLHSATLENEALTRRFTESADAVLWLTSSTSPGQVQELGELGLELRRGKPLLPVLTRSDVYDEDEVDGNIVKVLRSKTLENRTEQESDVLARAAHKLVAMNVDPRQLMPPVSVSSLLARAHGATGETLADAGFERLYAGLSEIVGPALSYKRRKHAEILMHHLEEDVQGALDGDMASHVARLRALAAATLAALTQQQEALADAMWRSSLPQLPALLDTVATSGNWQSAIDDVSQVVRTAYCEVAVQQLHEYRIDTGVARHHAPVAGQAGAFDYQAAYTALAEFVRGQVTGLAEEAATQCRAAILHLDRQAQRLETIRRDQAAALRAIKTLLRSQFA